MIAQRQQLDAVFGSAIEPAPSRDDAPLQGKPLTAPDANPREVVQRAVGFEFQTYNDSTKLQIVHGTQPKQDVDDDEQRRTERKRSTLPREVEGGPRDPGASFGTDVVAPPEWIEYFEDVDERYAQGSGVKIEKDGSDLEFVTNAFEESDSGRSALTQAIRTIIIAALAMERRLTLTSSIAARGPGLARGDDARDTVRVKSMGPMKAQVQATIGVKLEALDRLISVLGRAPKRQSSNDLGKLYEDESQRPKDRLTPPKVKTKEPPTLADKLGEELGNNEDNKTQAGLVRAYKRAATLVDTVMKGRPKETVRLRGLVHLIGLYVLGAGEKAKYAKARTPIMSRTDLADAVFALTAEEKALFAKMIIPAMSEWFEANKIDPSKALYRTFPVGEAAAMGLSEEDNATITINSWIQGLLPLDEETPGTDQMNSFDGFAVIANANKTDHPDPDNYREKWFAGEYGQRMESSTDIGARETTSGIAPMARRTHGLILELRNLGHDNLDVSEWASFALSLFDLIVLVNSTDAREEAALAGAMLRQRSFSTDLGDTQVEGIFKMARALLSEEF